MFQRTVRSLAAGAVLALALACSGGGGESVTDPGGDPGTDPTPCQPSSCPSDACGAFPDGCGATLECTCASPLACGAITPGRCASCTADGLCAERVTSTKPGFRHVFGTSPTDVWLVDRALSGSVFQWDGSGWRDRSSAHAKGGPDRIWGTGPASLWGVSGWGIWRWDGTAWSLPVTAWTNLKSIWGTAEDDVWAVGAGGVILHYDGTAWTQQTSPTTSTLYDVWAGAADDAWAVGPSYQLLHWDGQSWTSLTAVSTSLALTEVQGVGPNEALVLASDGVIELWNGTDFVSHGAGQSGDAYAFWAFAKDDVWSAGYYGTVEHYEGASWVDLERSTTGDLWGVWGASNGDVWIPILDQRVLRREAP
jgi:hypothetical protein